MGTAGSSRSASILVVDDDTDVRETLCDFLVTEGYTVRRAADGREALDDLRRDGAPDVVLLDLRMPVMDGYEFLRRHDADQKLKDVPVIIVSATTERQPIQHVAAIFRKPVNLDLLLGALRKEVMKNYAAAGPVVATFPTPRKN